MDMTAPASLLDAVDTRTAMADVLTRLGSADPPPASMVAEVVATRPVGGKRKATSTTKAPSRTAASSGGKRASRNTIESILVDAADAANHLSMCAITWDATQILAHAEITRLALAEALRDLDEERKAIDHPPRGRRKSKRKRAAAHADIQRRAAVILQAAELLAAVHDRELVRGD